MPNQNRVEFHSSNDSRRKLAARLKELPPNEGAMLLATTDDPLAFEALSELNPSFIQDILAALPEERRQAITGCAPPELARQWETNHSFEAGTIGRFMEPAYAEFVPGMTVSRAIEILRGLIKTTLITYGYVTGQNRRLLGLVTMRDLLFAEREAQLGDIMRAMCLCSGPMWRCRK